MQCCVLKYFADVHVTYRYTNRTPAMKFSRKASQWLETQISKLADIRLSAAELAFLQRSCPYLNEPYLHYLATFRLDPATQVTLSFHASPDTGADSDMGDLELTVAGLWVETIPYEIALLALVSECYFRHMDTDWSHAGQADRAAAKGAALLAGGCVFSEFGSRRRRDYATQELVLRGLVAATESAGPGAPGRFSGTSNVHFAMKLGLQPVGTVAHEWFMGLAAVSGDYENANEAALRYWVSMFGEGVLGIALTDTFGTADFLKAFAKPVPESLCTAKADAAVENGVVEKRQRTYAEIFTGVRQDSGDPETYVKQMREFYSSQGITEKKVIVFSDSLNVGLCLKYKKEAEDAGFLPTFGVGTFLTNDFARLSDGTKSAPLNIVIKLASANGKPAVKISDNIGKNTGDKGTVEEVKRRLGYTEKEWAEGDESKRWGKAGDQASGLRD